MHQGFRAAATTTSHCWGAWGMHVLPHNCTCHHLLQAFRWNPPVDGHLDSCGWCYGIALVSSQGSPTPQLQSCSSSHLFSWLASRLFNPYPYCWYHQQFGASTHKCCQPCAFQGIELPSHYIVATSTTGHRTCGTCMLCLHQHIL